jgi:hypothetical protein
MARLLRRTVLLACALAAIGAGAFAQVASANYFATADVTCGTATYNYSTFPGGSQTVMETVFVDGAVALQTFLTFTGPVGTDTVHFTVPNDGFQHYIEAYSYSITNGSPVFGLPGVATLTCGSPPPPPPPVCTYTKGFYRNHPGTTASVIAAMGGTVTAGSAHLTAAQAQAVLNTTPGQASNVTYTSNLLLNVVQQLLAAELNLARGSPASAGIQAAIASTNGAITVTTGGGQIQLSTALSTTAASALGDALAGFNTSADCG